MFSMKLSKIIGLVIVGFSINLFSQDSFNQNNEMQEVYSEYLQISQQLQNIQQQAFADSNVAELGEEFNEKLESFMINQDSSVAQVLEKREELVTDFEEAKESGNQEELMKLQQEFQSVMQQLQSHQQQAMQNVELQQLGSKLEEKLISKMTEINPDVPNLFARLETLGSKLEELRTKQ